MTHSDTWFPEVHQIPFEGPDSQNPLAFTHYNADEVVGLLRIVDGALLQAGGDHEHDVRIRDLAQGCQGRSAAV